MDSAMMHKGTIGLNPGEILRLREPAGRHIGVVRGVAWVTQDGDPRDYVLGSGESFRFDRNGVALVMPLGVEAKLVLEEGLAPESLETPDSLSLHREDVAHFERRARRMRAEAVAQAFASLAGGLKALWGRIARMPSAASQARKTVRDLRSLSDHMLRDIGLRRDQIDCIAKRLPC